MTSTLAKRSIAERFDDRSLAERYRNRFKSGKRKRTHEREAGALRNLIARLGAVETILDVGSGAGRFIPVFSQFTSHIVQADFSLQMLAVARDEHAQRQQGAAFVNADAQALPFADRFADVAFCHRLLNHLPKASTRRMVLSEMKRVSRRWVVISCLAPPSSIRLIRRWYDRLRGHQSLDGHIAPADLLEDAAQCGLSLIRRERFRSFPVVGEYFVLESRNPAFVE